MTPATSRYIFGKAIGASLPHIGKPLKTSLNHATKKTSQFIPSRKFTEGSFFIGEGLYIYALSKGVKYFGDEDKAPITKGLAQVLSIVGWTTMLFGYSKKHQGNNECKKSAAEESKTLSEIC